VLCTRPSDLPTDARSKIGRHAPEELFKDDARAQLEQGHHRGAHAAGAVGEERHARARGLRFQLRAEAAPHGCAEAPVEHGEHGGEELRALGLQPAAEVLPVPGLYHDRYRMVRWSKGPPVRGPLPCRRAQS
jgi:hypothetical protein